MSRCIARRSTTRLQHPTVPRLIAEVLSRSTEHVDYFVKVEEYKAVAALQVILLISPQTVDVGTWTRVADGWAYQVTRDPDGMVDLPDLGLELPVRDIYDGVVLSPPYGPRLVWPDEPHQR